MTFSSDLIRGHIDTIIMARLLKGDTYGYEINKELGTERRRRAAKILPSNNQRPR